MLTSDDYPIIQAGKTLLSTRPMKVIMPKDMQDDVSLGIGAPIIFRKGNLNLT